MSDLSRRITGVGLLLVAVALPLVLEDFWLQLGLFVMATMVGAVGLTLLVGVAGQLSLGHAAFAAIGAYVYVWATSDATPTLAGAGLPAVAGLVIAVASAALIGLLFSPVASRLRGIYLGLATIGLVFLARHLMVNIEAVTGGFNGRSVEPFSFPGFSFSNNDPDFLAVAGVEFEGLHRLWYLFLAVALFAAWVATNLKSSRTGRALANVRDSEAAAAAMGINVARAKATAFVVSSAYAGVAGALMALAFTRIAPDVFALQLSIDFLVMIVIGGLGSIGGAVLGAVFVSLLPRVMEKYSDSLPLLSQPGEDGVTPSQAARFLYGAAIIAVLLYLPGGIAGLGRRLKRKVTSDESDDDRQAAPEELPPLREPEVKETAT